MVLTLGVVFTTGVAFLGVTEGVETVWAVVVFLGCVFWITRVVGAF